MQLVTETDMPEQGAPPFLGDGLLHSLVLHLHLSILSSVDVEDSPKWEHVNQFDQPLHPPSTKKKNFFFFKKTYKQQTNKRSKNLPGTFNSGHCVTDWNQCELNGLPSGAVVHWSKSSFHPQCGSMALWHDAFVLCLWQWLVGILSTPVSKPT